MKNWISNNWMWALPVAVLLVIVVIYIFKDHNKPKLKDENGSLVNGFIPKTDTLDPNRVLHKNDTGNTVIALQEAVNDTLTKMGSPSPLLTKDGVYGSATDNAVIEISGGKLRSSSNNVTVLAVKNL